MIEISSLWRPLLRHRGAAKKTAKHHSLIVFTDLMLKDTEGGGRKEGKEGRENEMKTTRFICRGRNYSLGLPPRNYICN